MFKLISMLTLGLLFLGSETPVVFAQDTVLKEALELDRQGFIAESIPAWQKFLKTGPPKKLSIYAQIKITIAYSRTGRFGEALKFVNALAAAYPDHFHVQFNFGNMLGATHQYAKAAEAYRQATTMKPREGLAYVGYGICLFGDGKPEEAVKVLRKVRALFKKQKNVSWYQHVRIMIGQIKGFAPYPQDFSDLWRTNNLKKVRETYESSLLKEFENELNL